MSSLPPFEKGDLNSLPAKVQEFVSGYAKIFKPQNIHICDGSAEENKELVDRLIKVGACAPLTKHDNW